MDEHLEVALRAARAGGAIVREAFGRARTGVSSKSSPTDVVTSTDRASEEAIKALISAARPSDGFLGEETGESGGTSGLRWVVDPLDGTVDFLYGLPQVAVSVACEDASGRLAGVVLDPLREEEFTAVRGGGAYLNGEPISVRDPAGLDDALIATGFSYLPEERAVAGAVLTHVLPRVRDVRRAGAAALDLAWVACGRLDGYYEAPCLPWDGAAGELLVAEAGGLVGPMDALGPSGPGTIAAGPVIYEALRDLVAEARAKVGA